jgi:hypothetical protein
VRVLVCARPRLEAAPAGRVVVVDALVRVARERDALVVREPPALRCEARVARVQLERAAVVRVRARVETPARSASGARRGKRARTGSYS